FDPTNRKVDADKHEGAAPQMHYCAQWPGNYRVQAQVKKGAGEIAVQAFTVPLGAPPVVEQPPSVVAPQPQPPQPIVRAPRDPLPVGDALAAMVDREASAVAPAS